MHAYSLGESEKRILKPLHVCEFWEVHQWRERERERDREVQRGRQTSSEMGERTFANCLVDFSIFLQCKTNGEIFGGINKHK